MTNPPEKLGAFGQPIMIIRGIPFYGYAAKDGGERFSSEDIESKPYPRRVPLAPAMGAMWPLHKQQSAIHQFSGRSVPMRLLRELVLVACAGLGHRSRLVRFTVVEAEPGMLRIAEAVAPQLCQEGLLPETDQSKTDIRSRVFGQAPHLVVLYGPTPAPEAAAVCVEAATRLDWIAGGAGIGVIFEENIVKVATSSAVAAALTVPDGHTVLAALLLGYPAVAAPASGKPPETTLIWI